LLKHLHKFYNHEDLPWVKHTWQCLYSNSVVPQIKRPIGSFWWRDVMSHSKNFLMIATCNVGRGNSVCFWSHTWNLGVLKWKFPHLFSFAKNQNISVEKILSQDVYANFSAPLTVEAVEQWIQLSAMLHNMKSTTNGDEHWSL
jgi:hypothetical protein